MSSYWLTPELIHTDENGMLFGIGDRPGRVFWGLLFAGLGIAAIVAPLIIGPENMRMDPPDAMPPLVAQVLTAAVALVLMVVGWTVACSVDELRLDLGARSAQCGLIHIHTAMTEWLSPAYSSHLAPRPSSRHVRWRSSLQKWPKAKLVGNRVSVHPHHGRPSS